MIGFDIIKFKDRNVVGIIIGTSKEAYLGLTLGVWWWQIRIGFIRKSIK